MAYKKSDYEKLASGHDKRPAEKFRRFSDWKAANPPTYPYPVLFDARQQAALGGALDDAVKAALAARDTARRKAVSEQQSIRARKLRPRSKRRVGDNATTMEALVTTLTKPEFDGLAAKKLWLTLFALLGNAGASPKEETGTDEKLWAYTYDDNGTRHRIKFKTFQNRLSTARKGRQTNNPG